MRRHYEMDLKVTLVKLLESGRSTRELSEEYGVASDLLRRWRREYSSKQGDFSKKVELSSDQIEIRQLRKEVADIKTERDILKKAVSIFSKSDK